jgi:hypothetical protein
MGYGTTNVKGVLSPFYSVWMLLAPSPLPVSSVGDVMLVFFVVLLPPSTLDVQYVLIKDSVD